MDQFQKMTQLDEAQLLQTLRRVGLFADLDDVGLRMLLPAVHPLNVEAHATIFRQGEPASHFYLVRGGQVKLFRVSPEGDEKIIELISPGQTFAEAVMFLGPKGRYPVNAQTLGPASLLVFDQTTFLDRLRQTPELSFALLGSLSRRLHGLVDQIESLTLQNATDRLIIYLLDHVPGGVQAAPEITLTTPKNAIASRLAIQPETFSRILARLRDHGLIEVRGHHIVLRDIAALRERVSLPPRR
jgi:CRP-like cAMP-binding protein